MTDPYRGSARAGSRRRGSYDDDDGGFGDYLSEISGRGSGRASVRSRHSYSDSESYSYSDTPGSYSDTASNYSSAGRASVGRHSAGGRHSASDYDDYDRGSSAAAHGSVGRASVGTASVGAASARAQVPPEGYGGGYGDYDDYGDHAGQGGYGDYGDYDDPDRRPKRSDRHRQPNLSERAKRRRRQKKIVAISAVAVMLAGFMVLAGTYFVVNVPLPSELAAKEQASTILAADGKTKLAGVGDVNRKYVTIDKIPEHVQHAVVTAEDRSFYTNSGIDIKGIMRAAWNNVTDGDTEGASTITQQYVRNAADLDRSVSYTRKLKEMAMAVKINDQLTKDQILEYYLNTIYFGRQAYGIEAASQAYFGKSVAKVTPEEGALLAAIIKSPEGYDPETAANPDSIEKRWRWVMTSMVEENWLDASVPAKATFPKTRPKSEAKGGSFGLDKPTGHIIKYVKDELEALGISEQDLATKGYTVQTTIRPGMQRAAEKAAAKVLKGQPKKLATGLVAVQPGTGEVMAYYGGKNGVAGYDFAGSYHQPGSSFKAYALAAALEEGISVQSYWDGYSPKEFPDRGKPVRNSENNNSCKRCTLQRATVLSLNTTYYGLTYKLGKEKVIDLARKAGIRTMKTDDLKTIKLNDNPDFAKPFSTEVGIGQFPVTVLDNANGFATFAANGVAAEVHFVKKVIQGEEVLHEIKPETHQAFSPETAADATHVMKDIAPKLEDGRPVAGKTGTWQYRDTDDNAHAWMAGYTPQVAAAVWMGREGKEGPLKTKDNMRIYGSGLPSEIWKAFMEGAHKNKDVEKFPDPVFKGDATAGDAKSPSPSPTPSEEPTKPGNGNPHKPGGPSDSPAPTPTPTCTEIFGNCNGRGNNEVSPSPST